jgi:hypothetical protein
VIALYILYLTYSVIIEVALEYRNLERCRERLEWAKKIGIGIDTRQASTHPLALVLIVPSVVPMESRRGKRVKRGKTQRVVPMKSKGGNRVKRDLVSNASLLPNIQRSLVHLRQHQQTFRCVPVPGVIDSF